MANLTGPTQLLGADTTQVDTTAVHKLGTRAFDADGNEYIYLQGVASTAASDWVTYDEAFATARLVADANGPVAVAMAAIVASSYGWYMIWGDVSAAGTATTDNTAVYIDSNAGKVDDTGVAGDLVFGVTARSTVSGGLFTAQLTHPYVLDGAYLV